VRVGALLPRRHDLVRGDRDGPDLLLGAGVLADLVLGQRGALQQLLLPLVRGDGVGDQDQGGGPGLGHRGGADDGLAGSTGQDDHAGAAVPERVGGVLLVRAERPAVLHEGDGVRLAVHVPGHVLGGPADLEQGLLERAALARMDDDGVLADALAQHALDLLGAQDLLKDRTVGGVHDEAVHGVLLQAQPPVPRHRVGHVDQQGVRYGVAGELQQRVDDLLGVVAGGAGVPEGERGDPVHVDVLGGAFEFGERRDLLAAFVGHQVADLEQQGLVGLDDERSVGHGRQPPSEGRRVDGPSYGQRVPAPGGARYPRWGDAAGRCGKRSVSQPRGAPWSSRPGPVAAEGQ
jgi:hypothetical protein